MGENKLKVDAIIGYKLGEMFGKYKVYYKTSEKLGENIDFNEISYIIPKYKLPYKHIIYNSVIYPIIVKRSIRNVANITHIFSQEEAYLLNMIKFSNPTIVTCLDIIPLLFQKNSDIINRFFMDYSINGMKKADCVITISNHTKNDLIKYVKIPDEKIETIYLGVDDSFKILSKNKIDDFKNKYNLPNNFVLYLGSEQPRKNFPLLIKAFYKLKKEVNSIILNW